MPPAESSKPSEHSESTGMKLALIVISSLLGILTTVAIIFGSALLSSINESDKSRQSLAESLTNRLASIDTQIALVKQDVTLLKASDRVDDSQQAQLSKQWEWLGLLHDEINRMRFKENLNLIPRPSKPNP